MASNKNGSKPSVQELRRERFWGKNGQPGWYDEIGRPPYSPAFITTLAAVIDDKRRSTYERSLAWWQLEAWGNSSTPAIEIVTGKLRTMAECAERLQVNICQVSRAFQEQTERKEMYTDERGGYCPVRDPKSEEETKRCCVRTQPPNEEPITYKVSFLTFVNDVWRAENPLAAEEWDHAEKLKALRAEIKAEEDEIRHRLLPKQLNSFKKYKKAAPSPETCVRTQQDQAQETAVEVADVRNESEDTYATVYIRKHYSTEESVVVVEEVVSTKSSSSSLPDTEPPTTTKVQEILQEKLPKLAEKGSLTNTQTADAHAGFLKLTEPEKAVQCFFDHYLPPRLDRLKHIGSIPFLISNEFAKAWPELLREHYPTIPEFIPLTRDQRIQDLRFTLAVMQEQEGEIRSSTQDYLDKAAPDELEEAKKLYALNPNLW